MPSTTEEFHALVTDLESALKQISDQTARLIQAVSDHPQGNVVDPADLAALHVAIDEAHSIAAAAVAPQAGTPVPDTGTPETGLQGATAGPVDNPGQPLTTQAGDPVPAAEAAPTEPALPADTLPSDTTADVPTGAEPPTDDTE